MSNMTPEQEAAYAEAAYALDNGLSSDNLSSAAQLEYDRLKEIPKIVRWAAEASGQDSFSTARPAASGQQSTAEGEPSEPSTCSGCGEELTPNARFCASCGEPANIRSVGRSSIPGDANQSSASAEKTLQEFTVKYVTFYDGSGHRLGPSECTLTSRRLIINDVRGGMHQILLRDISGTSTPSRLAAPKMLRISLPAQAYDIDCSSKDQKFAIEAWLSQAIRGSLS
jgi:hypothetical protein